MNKRNKLWRRLKELNNWYRRIKIYGYFKHGKPEDFTYCWKAQGKPCSCIMCSGNKYKRAEKHKKTLENYLEQIKNEENGNK